MRKLQIPLYLLLLAASLPATSQAASSALPDSELWAKRYNGTGSRDDFAVDLAVSADGSTAFVTGRSMGAAGARDWDYATIAYDTSTGSRLWTSRYGGSGDDWDAPSALGLSPDGSAVYVTGSSLGATSGFDYATVAYDAATGTTLWEQRYDGPSNDADPTNDSAFALAVSPDGSAVFLTGDSDERGYTTIAIDAVTGAKLWLRRETATADYAIATALAVSADGSGVFVTGTSYAPATSEDYATVAYDAATGRRLWAARYTGPGDGNDAPSGLAVSPDDAGVFVIGTSEGTHDGIAYAAAAYDPVTGAELWVRRYLGGRSMTPTASPLAVAPDSSTLFLTGSRGRARRSEDIATVALDAATGTTLWEQRYNGRADASDWGGGVAVSADGSTVFATGTSIGSTTRGDFATLAYDAATGARLWARRYNGRANGWDGASDLAVSPYGSTVFVTGASLGSTRYDYVTVAYART